jgi:type VI secretion system protein ImpE
VTAAESKLRAGDLAGCLMDLQTQVRVEPADSKQRVFLAQLLMVMGQWDRASRELAVAAELDAGASPMAISCRAAIQAEEQRAAVLRGERSPLIFGDTEPWIALLIEALAAQAAGSAGRAAELRAAAFAAAPATAGSLNGVEFEWIADADSRFGPVLEVVLEGSYYWVPFSRLAAVALQPPTDLRDLVWMPAKLTWAKGGEAMGFIPTRYHGSESATDAGVRLARRTQWSSLGSPDAWAGLGQRMLMTSAEEISLLEVRRLALGPAGT